MRDAGAPPRLAQLLGEAAQAPERIAVREQRRDRAHHHGGLAEGLDFVAERARQLRLLDERRERGRLELERLGDEQPLARHALAEPRRAQALVEDALVRGVL